MRSFARIYTFYQGIPNEKHYVNVELITLYCLGLSGEVHELRKVERKYLKTLKVTLSQHFADLGRVWMDQKSLTLLLLKAVSLYMIALSLTAVHSLKDW